jgi:hypothetical membrane protein
MAFIVGGLQYAALEAVAAFAWSSPPYDYVYNYISDLGVPDPQVYNGRDVDSPLAWVMNTGLVVHGLLFALGAVLLARLFAGAARRLFVAFALLHGVGIVLVGVFHEASGVALAHVAGAFLAILFGNLAALVAGLSWRTLGLPCWFGVAAVALPVVGLLSEVVLLAGLVDARFDGLFERGGVYSITVWEVLFGALMLWRLRSPLASRV